jgi:hypothetical protein
MDQYVRTRWTENGQVEILIDVNTAQAVLRDLGATSGALTVKLYESLGHTLLANDPNYPKERKP